MGNDGAKGRTKCRGRSTCIEPETEMSYTDIRVFFNWYSVLNLHPQPKALILREVPLAACHLVLMEINYL